MKRRDFLKTSGVGALALMSVPANSFGQQSNNSREKSLLLEAERFDDKGGWTVDSQFFDELGFAYLLAHGLGEPVVNAKTVAAFPETGKYWVWVHTKNWVPGDWEAPGRFELRINGKPVGEVFGTKAGWTWHKAGPVEIESTEATIELVDLTGFDGRCDAVFFSKDPDDRPPEDTATLSDWRRRKAGIPKTPGADDTYDVVIVGGGLAGCAAALSAHEQGLKVALVQDRQVYGGNSSSEIRVHTLGISGKREDIIGQIDTAHYPNGSPDAKGFDRKRHKAIDAAKNIHQFLGHSVYAVHTSGDQICSVDAFQFETGKTRRFKAPVFIDCTGDGWLGYWAGAEYRYGRESRREFNEGWERYGDLWSPEKTDNRVMGASVLWRSRQVDQEVPFPDVPWAMPVAKHYMSVNGEWYWEYSANDAHQVKDAEQVRDHMLRAIYGSFANAKKKSENARTQLEWVSYLVGKRESRRLMGDYIYTMNDALESRDFADTVVIEERDVDVHYQRVLEGYPVDFISKAMYRKPAKKRYNVPFRCLYSRNIGNLMMAGRCFSCSHIGLGGPRVMRTCGQMGVAVGFAAALCNKYKASPRQIAGEHVQELRKLCGYI